MLQVIHPSVINRPFLECLTPRQQKLVLLRTAHPDFSNSKVILMAGYSPSCVTAGGQKVLKSTKVKAAIKSILSESFPDYDKSPREWIKRELLKEATGQTQDATSPKRLRALELLGKMTGEFKEKVAVDLTDEKRREMAGRLLQD